MSVATEMMARVKGAGYAFVPAFELDKSTEEVARLLGTIANIGSRTAHPLIPKDRNESTPNSYSGIYGKARFPLHTDLAHWREPPRYVALRCIKGYKEIKTNLVDGYRVLGGLDCDATSLAIFNPRRPQGGVLPILKLYHSTADGTKLLRWDEVFLRPANQCGKSAVILFKMALKLAPQESIELFNYGDTLIIDNWRMLHSRSQIPPDCTDRKIERIYLEP